MFRKLNEVWKNGKLVSKKPALLRRCVVDVYKKGDEKGKKGVERAFAICYSSLQKNGLMDGNKLTDKGRKKSYVDKEKDQEYEKIINQVSKNKEECTMKNRKLRELLEEVQELSGMGDRRASLNEGLLSRSAEASLTHIIDYAEDIREFKGQDFRELLRDYRSLDENHPDARKIKNFLEKLISDARTHQALFNRKIWDIIQYRDDLSRGEW